VNKKAKILFFCMIFVAQNIFSQNVQQKKASLLILSSYPKPVSATLSINKANGIPIQSQPILPPNYYSTRLGFFCKQEIKFENIYKIPFKFRLGSVEECDRLEGKRRIN
jgi:hypothetical protein